MTRYIPIVLVLLLVGCATLAGRVDPDEVVTETTGDVCKVWQSISYDSTKDTPQTVEEVRANNRAREAYCEGD